MFQFAHSLLLRRRLSFFPLNLNKVYGRPIGRLIFSIGMNIATIQNSGAHPVRKMMFADSTGVAYASQLLEGSCRNADQQGNVHRLRFVRVKMSGRGY
jgi:hypothetical protein